MTDPNVFAVVVTYEPNAERLALVLLAASRQVTRLLVVDNSLSEEGRDVCKSACSAANVGSATILHHPSGDNIGLSAAYNIAIERAQTDGADYLLLLDQDSIVASDMVSALVRGMRKGEQTAEQFGQQGAPLTVGPWYIDELTGRRSVVLQTGRWFVNYIPEPDCEPGAQHELMPTEMLISSGSLIPLSAFKTLGPLDASLFIDHIDTDWCLRVRASGGWMAVVPDAHMRHQLGDRAVRFWLGHWRLLPVHSPIRLYYSFRNSLWLYIRPHAHWRWIGFDLKRLLAVTFIHSVADGSRWERMKMICRGIADGLRGWKPDWKKI